jgi:hypothetical protein
VNLACFIFKKIIVFESDQFSPSHSVTRCEGPICDAKHGRPAKLSRRPTCSVLAPGELIVGSAVKMKRAPLGISASMHQVFLHAVGLLCAP